MTIKQQGGIFGRNPTFNDVDVEGTLTVNGEPISDFGTMAQQDADAVAITGGSGAFDTFSADTDTLYVDAVNNRVGMGTTSPTFELHLARNSAGIFVQSTNSQEAEVRLDNTIRSWTQYVDGSGNYNFRDRTGAKTVLQFTTTGNLAVANGNGIDFSATSGTGTSELFDDYEEGTYTVSLHDGSSSGNASSTTTTGYYTKVGRVVTCSFASLSNISTAGMTTSNVLYMSLPFDAAQGASGSMAISVVDARQASGQGYVVPVVVAGNSRARFYGCQSGNAVSSIRPAELTSGTSDFVNFTMTYIAS